MSVRGLRMFLKGEEGLTRERDDVRWWVGFGGLGDTFIFSRPLGGSGLFSHIGSILDYTTL